jgi:hypothetical protein
MRRSLLAALSAALVTWACGGGAGGGGGGGASSGPVTAPSPPAQPQPAAVNVNSHGSNGGQPVDIVWTGNVSFDEQTGANTISLDLTQTGSQISGTVNLFGPDGGAGPIAGVVSGNIISFNFSIGNGGQGCGNSVAGSATVSSTSITATFSGRRCNGRTYTNGRFAVSAPSVFRTSPYPVGGTWTANIPPAVGGGRWTFNISETVTDVNGGTVAGSVSVAGSSLNLGSGTLSGPVTSTFPGPTTIVRMTVVFSGACMSNLVVTQGSIGGNPAFDGSQMTGSITGSTCSASIQSIGLNLFRP